MTDTQPRRQSVAETRRKSMARQSLSGRRVSIVFKPTDPGLATVSNFLSYCLTGFLFVFTLYVSIPLATLMFPYIFNGKFDQFQPGETFNWDWRRLHAWTISTYTSMEFAGGEMSVFVMKNVDYLQGRVPLAIHSFAGLLGVLCGFHQISYWAQRKSMQNHRIVGYVYFFALTFVMWGACNRLYTLTPFELYGGPGFYFSLIMFSGGAIISAVLALGFIRMGYEERHRQWAAVNYSLMWGASFFRFGYAALFHISGANMLETVNPDMASVYVFTEWYLHIWSSFFQKGYFVFDDRDRRNLTFPQATREYFVDQETSESFYVAHALWNLVTNIVSWVYLTFHVFPHVSKIFMLCLAVTWTTAALLGSFILADVQLAFARNDKQHNFSSELYAQFVGAQVLGVGLIYYGLGIGLDYVTTTPDDELRFISPWFWYMQMLSLPVYTGLVIVTCNRRDMGRMWEWTLHAVWLPQFQWLGLCGIVLEIMIGDFEKAFGCAVHFSNLVPVVLIFAILSYCTHDGKIMRNMIKEE